MAGHVLDQLGRLRRDRWGAGAVVLMLGVVVTVAVLHTQPSAAQGGRSAAGAQRLAPEALDGEQGLTALHQRCTLAMVQGSCQVMSSPGEAAAAASRVFIAGVGEVNAALYDSLRQQGQAMCDEVVAACRQEQDGASCRIAHALYPLAR